MRGQNAVSVNSQVNKCRLSFYCFPCTGLGNMEKTGEEDHSFPRGRLMFSFFSVLFITAGILIHPLVTASRHWNGTIQFSYIYNVFNSQATINNFKANMEGLKNKHKKLPKVYWVSSKVFPKFSHKALHWNKYSKLLRWKLGS